MPWFVAAAVYVLLFIYAAPKLTTAKIEAARVEGIAAKKADGELPTDRSIDVGREAIAETGLPGAIPTEPGDDT
jgi:hypothetical protein